MAIIGGFTKDKTGGFSGAIKTLTQDFTVTLRPVEKDNDKAPDFRVLKGDVEIGAAWKKTSRQQNEYVSVKLEDPFLPRPIFANLMEAEEGYRLIWSSDRRAD